MQKKTSIIIGISILILAMGIIAVGGFFAYQFFTKVNTPEAENSTAGWKTYTNTEYGFEIKYPSEFENAKIFPENVLDCNSQVYNEIGLVSFKNIGIHIACPNILNSVQNSQVYKGDKNTIIIAGRQAYIFEYTSTTNYTNKEAYIPLSNGNYLVIYHTYKSGRPIDYLELSSNQWQNMLSTFKFTTPIDSTAGWKTYTNTQYGFEFKYPNDSKINDVDITGGRMLALNVDDVFLEIDVQNQMYGAKGILVPAVCNDNGGVNNPSTQVEINGINFAKTDVSGDYGGMQSAAVAEAFCTVNNNVRYRLVPRIQFSRYTGGTEKGDIGNVPNLRPDKVLSFQKFEKIVNDINFRFTTLIDPTADWKTYTSTQYGFEIKYPTNLSAVTEEDMGYSVNFHSGTINEDNKNGRFLIRLVSTDDFKGLNNCNLSSLFSEQIGYNCKNNCTCTNCGTIPLCSKIEKIADYKAIRFEEIGGDFHFLLENKNNYFEVSYFGGSSLSQDVISQMLSTFKFTTPKVVSTLQLWPDVNSFNLVGKTFQAKGMGGSAKSVKNIKVYINSSTKFSSKDIATSMNSFQDMYTIMKDWVGFEWWFTVKGIYQEDGSFLANDISIAGQ
ncbi:MAG: hypothetical protein PHD05_01825 [Sphaerochaetaceae bacterium]|nr:hypothetical protein [Sphaerochaetaceae bacterium]